MADARITGRFLAVVADSTADADESPDFVPLSGTVTLTPSAPAILQTGQQPVTYLTTPIVALLDAEGYVSLNGVRGLNVLAPDPSLNPSTWTYTVTPAFSLGNRVVSYPGWSIEVEAGATVDLTLAAPVPSSVGPSVTRGIGVQSARHESGSLVLTLQDGTDLAPIPLPPGSGVHVQDTDPGMAYPGLWIQTGLGPDGSGITFWIEDNS